MSYKLELKDTLGVPKMYTLTSSGADSHRAQVVVITCQVCGYFEGHFRHRGLQKVGQTCDRCQRQDRRS